MSCPHTLHFENPDELADWMKEQMQLVASSGANGVLFGGSWEEEVKHGIRYMMDKNLINASKEPFQVVEIPLEIIVRVPEGWRP